jgi:hypothetical protein
VAASDVRFDRGVTSIHEQQAARLAATVTWAEKIRAALGPTLRANGHRVHFRPASQVEGYAAIIDEHAALFAKLHGALLGREVVFDGPPEKWIVWPTAGDGTDRRERELLARSIRVVRYHELEGQYRLRVGAAPK